MSYQNLGDNSSGGYGQYNPYGSQQQNPYGAQEQQSYGYGAGAGYNQAGAAEQGNGGYEMSNINQASSGGPTSILNKCKEMNEGIAELTKKRETQLVAAQKALLDSSTGKEDQASRQTLDYIEDEINTALRYLRDQFKRIKETPGSGDSRVQGQVENVSRNLRREIEQYQRTQSDFQKRLEEQVRRRYEIANPEASPRSWSRVPGTRTRQANDARQATLQRSAAIRKIEQDLIELSHLYNEVAELVQQQEPAVQHIQERTAVAEENVKSGTTKIDHAIQSAKNARRWKWYALLVVIIIIAIIVGVVAGIFANRNKGDGK
ncbi:hypothetical protein N7445_010490 [Penicillium cf. griseofulvum]|nr:hypothetical protein N7445_010490 [Penicillium cf. griseofulvum]